MTDEVAGARAERPTVDGWAYEDELPDDLSDGDYAAMYRVSVVDGVRLFPYRLMDGQKVYLRAAGARAERREAGPCPDCGEDASRVGHANDCPGGNRTATPAECREAPTEGLGVQGVVDAYATAVAPREAPDLTAVEEAFKAGYRLGARLGR